MDTENNRPTSRPAPSIVPGVVLLTLGAVLIVVLLVAPDMPGWARITLVIVAIVLVVVLLAWSVRLFRVASGKAGRR